VEDIHILAGRYRGKPTVGPLFALAVGAGIQTDVPLAIRGVEGGAYDASLVSIPLTY